MFPLREPPLWMLGTGLVGYILGHWKGIPRWGFLLGLVLGPLGWGIIMVWPAQAGVRLRNGAGSPWGAGPSARNFRPFDRESQAAGPEGQGAQGSASFFSNSCPRCGQSVPRGKGACPHCGNVLVPVRYRVADSGGETTAT